MWSCIACAATMMLRMYCAFSGTASWSAFSTARTDAIACTVVHTPQNRCVKSQASRGSRPCRMRSMPRNIWPDDHALRTNPPSTSASIRRCPSMRVTGSMVIRDMSLLQCEDRENLDDHDVSHDLAGDQPESDQDFGDAGKVRPLIAGAERDEVGVEAEEAARRHEQHGGAEQHAQPLPASVVQQDEHRDHHQPDFGEDQDAIEVEGEQRAELAPRRQVVATQPHVHDPERNDRPPEPGEHRA